MNEVQFGRWRILVDQLTTRRTLDRLPRVWPRSAGCSCAGCRNFHAQLATVYPAEGLDLLESIGLRPGDEIEIWEHGPVDGSWHIYGGFFHFVGELVEGRDALVWRETGGIWHASPDLEPVAGSLKLGVTPYGMLRLPAFRDFPVLQLEFSTLVPWILDEVPQYLTREEMQLQRSEGANE